MAKDGPGIKAFKEKLMTLACDCHPGTAENGWHETRGPNCRILNLAEWEALMSNVSEIASRIKHTGHNHQSHVQGCYRCDLSMHETTTGQEPS